MAKKKRSIPTTPANKKAAQKEPPEKNYQPVASNRRAFFNFEILERYEAGIQLMGTEIKSIRAGKIDLSDAYARSTNGEMWL
ncbi:MAG TPA: SsrA-binding protein, partial [Dehalococcoidia bacterium]|nr:SsrA-binding protein [Dehalococcoidia bacterium]